MTYGRAYVQSGAVVALHVSDGPITLIAFQGCEMFDLDLMAPITAADLTYADGAVTGPGVLTCNPV